MKEILSCFLILICFLSQYYHSICGQLFCCKINVSDNSDYFRETLDEDQDFRFLIRINTEPRLYCYVGKPLGDFLNDTQLNSMSFKYFPKIGLVFSWNFNVFGSIAFRYSNNQPPINDGIAPFLVTHTSKMWVGVIGFISAIAAESRVIYLNGILWCCKNGTSSRVNRTEIYFYPMLQRFSKVILGLSYIGMRCWKMTNRREVTYRYMSVKILSG